MKIYQIVSATDGSRSEPFSIASFEDLAPVLARISAEDAPILDDYVLVLVEDADGQPFASRAPMMRVSSVISTFTPTKE